MQTATFVSLLIGSFDSERIDRGQVTAEGFDIAAAQRLVGLRRIGSIRHKAVDQFTTIFSICSPYPLIGGAAVTACGAGSVITLDAIQNLCGIGVLSVVCGGGGQRSRPLASIQRAVRERRSADGGSGRVECD